MSATTYPEIHRDSKSQTKKPYVLLLWNDDVNVFDWIIRSLIDICGHRPEQAEQSALIAHHKGKCNVKKGDYQTLKKMKQAFDDRLIDVTIEKST